MKEDRYFVDQRGGCIAVRDREHPKHDPSYQGLHKNTIDVIEYRHGYTANDVWNVSEDDTKYMNNLCDWLNNKSKQMNTTKALEQIEQLETIVGYIKTLQREMDNANDAAHGDYGMMFPGLIPGLKHKIEIKTMAKARLIKRYKSLLNKMYLICIVS